MLIEIIATSLDEALLAEQLGAMRIELIDSFVDGGKSPARELARAISQQLSIPLNVMVRPHARNFIYDQQEMRLIHAEIDYLVRHTQVNDIVFGSLTPAGRINRQQLELVLHQLAGTGVGLTFHRAFDDSSDLLEDFKLLQEYAATPLRRVLTSGGKPTAVHGAALIQQMEAISRMRQEQGQAAVAVLAGSGVRPDNVQDLIKATQVRQIHLGTGVRSNGQLDPQLFQQLLSNIAALS